ncbi:MAG: GAF domain-containing protein [Spirulina sp.]
MSTITDETHPTPTLQPMEASPPARPPLSHHQSLLWTLRLVRRIRRSLDLDVVLQTTVSEVRRWLRVDRVLVLEFQSDWGGVVLVEDHLPDCQTLQGRRIYDDCFAEKWVKVYAQGRIQAVDDIETAGFSPCHQDLLRQLQVRANLVVPLRVRGQLWGLLVAQHCTAPRPWLSEELQVVKQLADQVGLAIEQSELYHQTQIALLQQTQAATQWKEQSARAREKHLASLGTLAGGLAHDLGEILTPIFLAAEMLKQPTLNEQQQQLWLNRIKSSAHRGASLIDQVLAFAQGLEGQRHSLQLAYLLGELVQTLAETEPESLLITSRLQGTRLWPVEADATHLNQVFTNLCRNACEAMPQGGQLHLSAHNVWWRGDPTYPQRSPGPYVVVTLSDTGEGMAPEVYDRCLDPFFTTRALEGHSGLGLSTALGLVQLYGGWLNLQSQSQIGTTVEVYLPAQVPDLDIPLLQRRLANLPTQPRTILLLLAEAEDRELLRAMIASGSHTVLTTEDGAEALTCVIEHQATLGAVVLDLALPTFNGGAMARRLEQMIPQVPILTLDSRSQISPVPDPARASTMAMQPLFLAPLLAQLAQVLS